jgi:small subunit ribosomal protein S6
LKTVAAKLYEGMFLVDSALAASDWQGVNDTISSILTKVGAEIVSINKWDDRRLAYDIRGKSRGAYILAYFRVDGSRITEIERAVQLSEQIMRLLVLSIEDLGEGYLAKETSEVMAQEAAPTDLPQAPPAAVDAEPAAATDAEPEAERKADEAPAVEQTSASSVEPESGLVGTEEAEVEKQQ